MAAQLLRDSLALAAYLAEQAVTPDSSKTIFLEYYRAFRQVGDALWLKLGYAARTHEPSMWLLGEALDEPRRLDRFREMRHDATYRAEGISTTAVIEIKSLWNEHAVRIVELLNR